VRLDCANVTLTVPGRVLCRDLSFSVAPGEVWGVLGANGCGKTTLLNALAGLHACPAGAVRWDGMPPQARPARARARDAGLLLQQEDAPFWGSALEYVRLGRYPRMRSWLAWQREDDVCAQEALDTLGLAQLADRTYATLSGGERQRARIAQLIAQAPGLFLLDEPLQHLDIRHQALVLALFRRLAREGPCAVLMVLHDALWPARACSHALLMFDDGETLSGAARDVLTQFNLERLYGCTLQGFGPEEGRYFLPHV